MRKLQIALLMLAMICGTAMAQEINHEVDIMHYFGCHKGGFATIDGGAQWQSYKLAQGQYNGGLISPKLRIAYQHFVRRHIGIGIGISYQELKIDSMPLRHYVQQIDGAIDEMGRTYQHRTVFSQFNESTQIAQIMVPLTICWQRNLGISWKIYAASGVAASFFPRGKYQTQGDLQTHMYFDELHWESGNLDGHHTYSGNGYKGKYSLDPKLSLTAELQLLYAITPLLDAYLGGSVNYTPADMPGKSSLPLYNPDCMDIDAYTSPRYNGIMKSEIALKMAALTPALMLGLRYRIGREAKLEFDDYTMRRHLQSVDETEFVRIRRSNFDNVMQQQRQHDDSVRLAEQDRIRREAEELERLRLQRTRDSLDSIASITPPVVVETQPEDTIDEQPVIVPPKPLEMTAEIEQAIDNLLSELMAEYQCDFNMAENSFKDKQGKNIDLLAGIMKEHSQIKIIVIGHTCDIGTLEQNKIMGQKRAEAFKYELVKRGVPGYQIRCESKWYSEPLVPNTSEANRKKNRRVELKRI